MTLGRACHGLIHPSSSSGRTCFIIDYRHPELGSDSIEPCKTMDHDEREMLNQVQHDEALIFT